MMTPDDLSVEKWAERHIIELGWVEREAVASCGCRAWRETVGDRTVIRVKSCIDRRAVVEACRKEIRKRCTPLDPLAKELEQALAGGGEK